MDQNDENSPFNDHQQLAIFQKAIEIFEIAHAIAALIDQEDDILGSIKGYLLEDAALLGAKIAGAEGGDLYDLRMENAAIIRKAARELGTHCTSLKLYGFTETHYLQLLRVALEEFRLLFIDWVKTFDPWNYVYDSWGLFNPPGVTDPDENS